MLWKKKHGFSLVELMVVVAILGIVSGVAIPAYMNHMNRANQTEALIALSTIQVEQEAFFERKNYSTYAGYIACLPSFNKGGSFATCASSCFNTACAAGTFKTSKGYTVTMAGTAGGFLATALKYYRGRTDIITISQTNGAPIVTNPAATGFSYYRWIFK